MRKVEATIYSSRQNPRCWGGLWTLTQERQVTDGDSFNHAGSWRGLCGPLRRTWDAIAAAGRGHAAAGSRHRERRLLRRLVAFSAQTWPRYVRESAAIRACSTQRPFRASAHRSAGRGVHRSGHVGSGNGAAGDASGHCRVAGPTAADAQRDAGMADSPGRFHDQPTPAGRFHPDAHRQRAGKAHTRRGRDLYQPPCGDAP